MGTVWVSFFSAASITVLLTTITSGTIPASFVALTRKRSASSADQ